MRICEIMELLSAKPLTEDCDESLEVSCACASDMMSDVLAFAKNDSILITGLCNPQVMRTAEMMDLAGVIFVRKKEPDANMLRLAEEIGLCVMTTDLSMFSTCGRLYGAGLVGGVEY